MKLHEVNRKKGGNRYCGPAAVSVLTGVDTDTASKIIRSENPRIRAVRGLAEVDLFRALKACGMTVETVPLKKKRGTLINWINENRDARTDDAVFLIVAGHHYQIINGSRYICGLTNTFVPFFHEKVKRRAHVRGVYRITCPNGISLPTIATPEHRKAKRDERATIAKAFSLARQWGISIEDDGYPDDYTWYVSIDGMFNGNEESDPWWDDHFAHTAEELLEHVEGYIEFLIREQAA